MQEIIDSFSSRICYLVFGVKIPLYLQYVLPVLIFYQKFKQLLKNKYFQLFIILAPPSVIFIRLLANDPFFLSDDFAHLRLVSQNSYLEIAKNALTGGGIWVGHRIVGAFWLFKAIFQTFGVSPEAYLTANFIFHSLNIYLFYLIVQRIKKTPMVVLTAFILGSFYLTWISNMHEIMGATFALLSTFFWVKWLSGDKKYYLYSILTYLLAILTKEITFLLPITLLFIAIFYNYYVSAVAREKVFKHLTPLFVIFLIYLFTYGTTFLNYLSLPSQDSYKITFNFVPFIENLRFYIGYTFPITNSTLAGLIIVFSTFILHDSIKRKPIATPFLLSFLFFLGPALLFEKRVSNYYSYIATFFLFMGLTFALNEIHSFIMNLLKNKPKIWQMVASIYLVMFLAIGVFGMNKIFMDNCFLIQYPWRNEHKAREARNFLFIYNKGKGTLTLNEK